MPEPRRNEPRVGGREAGRPLAKKQARRQAKGKPLSRKARSNGPPVWVFAAVGVLLVAAVAFFVYVSHTPNAKQVQPSTAGTQQVGQQVAVQPGTHIQPPQRATYASNPPSSGEHYSIPGEAPVPWGYSDRAIPPEYWVHNLEHGGVVVLYNCPTGCTDDQAKVKGFIDGAPTEAQFGEVKMVATEYPVPGHRFALVAWGWQLFMDNWDSAQAERFYEAHVDHGPEAVP